MSRITPEQTYQLLRAQGLAEAPAVILTAIAGAESGYNPAAVGDEHLANATWGPSIGLWQIRTLKAQTGTGRERDIQRLTGDTSFQARSAVTVWKSQGFHAWSAYTNQSYRAFLDDARKASDADTNGYQPSPVGAAVGAVGGALVNTGEAVTGAAGGALKGLDAIGSFFGALSQRGTWVRVLQVGGGAALVAGGLVMLGRPALLNAASQAVQLHPAGRAAAAARSVTSTGKG